MLEMEGLGVVVERLEGDGENCGSAPPWSVGHLSQVTQRQSYQMKTFNI